MGCMEIIYSESDSELRITPIGELDEHAAPDARASIDNMLLGGRYSSVVLDMSRLSFMDSTGIGVLVGRYKKFGKTSAFFVASPTPAVDKILKLSGVYTIMPRII